MGEIGSLHLHSHHIIHFNNKAERLSAISLSILAERKFTVIKSSKCLNLGLTLMGVI